MVVLRSTLFLGNFQWGEPKEGQGLNAVIFLRNFCFSNNIKTIVLVFYNLYIRSVVSGSSGHTRGVSPLQLWDIDRYVSWLHVDNHSKAQ